MFCKQCGSELKEGAAFCTNCGAKQTAEAPAAAPVQREADLDKTVGVFGDFSGANANAPDGAPADQPQYDPNAAAVQQYQKGFRQQAVGSPSNGKVGFGRAVALIFENYANFTGRASKSEYWWGFLLFFAINMVGALSTLPMMAVLLWLAFVVPNLSLNIRRLHDIGKAWYWILMGLIPFAGFIILIVYYCKDSDGDNQWGPATPNPDRKAYTNGAAAPRTVTDNDIVTMAQNHEPLILDTPEAKALLDAAINRLIPTYTGAEDLATAMLQCNPQNIKDNVAAADSDTLLVAFKALGYYIGLGADQNVLGLVQQNVLSVLKTRY